MGEKSAHSILKPKEVVDNWEVVRELGFGTFGAVYEVVNLTTKTREAMKVEKRSQDESSRTLKLEIQVLKELTDAKARNCCALRGSGRKSDYTYMVMTLVGPSFENLLHTCKNGKLSWYSAMYACLLALEGLEDLHKAKYVHRDVKPQNFSVGEGSLYRNVYVLDFGTARRFLKDNGQHHRPRARCGFPLNGEEQSRRDDLWSWFFVLLRLTTGTLPWLNLKVPPAFDAQLKVYADSKSANIENPGKMMSAPPPSVVESWQVVREIGCGTFGAVYEVVNLTTKAHEAMKVESREQPESCRTLKQEIAVLKELNENKARNCCALTGSGKLQEFSFMVMSLVGPSFESVVKNCKKPDGPPRLALEDLHKIRYIHRDIKPQNYAVGIASERYINDSGAHHRPRAKAAFRGTVWYASSNALRGEEQSRRDDMWAWYYILVRITQGDLPWMHLPAAASFEDELEATAKCKDENMLKCKKMLSSCPPEYQEILEVIRPLTYYMAPEYNSIYELLNKITQKELKGRTSLPLEWEGSTASTSSKTK
ncbi:Pkinase domain containing protein [Trichuris trichiura]|uniref:Pkinase domain containing protein n=1 Tax=Trichuris trichiura TaxID=36087 RepID=A0A077Z3H8_TRITR|nr:Pkinase domain containing protein [Trichuris trichiura]